MLEPQLRQLISKVKAGHLSRRAFTQRMIALGLTAPMATQMLAFCGAAAAQPNFTYAPKKRGGGGALKLLFWQGPTLLNPHLAVGTKDQEASRIFYEPLAGWSSQGELIPILAAEIPNRENGGLSPDGLSVTWRLKKDVLWHDGRQFTADDVIFNWEYSRNPETTAVTIGRYRDITVEKVDSLTVRIRFARPTPTWASAFVGPAGMIIPKHLFEAYTGANSREAPTNLRPIGTGPYRFVEFKPGDIVKGQINPLYHLPNRPFFDSIEMKGGGDAVSAARAVLQTGEYDFAWNVQVEDEILLRFEQRGRGRTEIISSGNVEHIQVNTTDPWTEIDGERSSIKTTHPLLSDPFVRQALSLLVDRISVQNFIYGRTGVATANFLNNPDRFRSNATQFEFNIDKANQVLELTDWKRGSDGIRAKGDRKLKLVFQTSINAPRQKTQAIIKQACQKAGIDVELKAVAGSVFFSADVGNPDTLQKFYCDLQMFTANMAEPDPERFMGQFCSWEIASKDNNWQGRNSSRWRNNEYDRAFRDAEHELDPVKRATLFMRMNELVVGDNGVIPIVHRPQAAAISNKLRVPLSGWDNNLWQIADWYRTE